ncbi:MAG: hypothetical protein ACTSQI_18630 [Candidatus Helarchaeota archaeon]
MANKLKSINEKDGWALMNLPETNPKTASGRNKTGARQIIFIQNAHRLLELARKVEHQKGKEARLFLWALGTLPVIFCRMKKRQVEAAAREGWNKLYSGRLYDLRHAAITEMYLNGFIDQEVRAMVGWTPSSKMPNVYVHVNERHLLDACQRVELHRYSNSSAPSKWGPEKPLSQNLEYFNTQRNPGNTIIPCLLARYSPE